MLKIVYQGVAGAYSHIAAQNIYPGQDYLPCETFEQAMDMVQKNLADVAVIPVENSNAGRVADVHFLLPRTGLFINGEYFLRVEHQLLGLKGAKLEEIVSASSHPQALAQCSEFLKKHKISAIARIDTAKSCQDIINFQDPRKAAIASRLAAKIYGLEILKSNIENDNNNTTRFLVMSRESQIPEDDGGRFIPPACSGSNRFPPRCTKRSAALPPMASTLPNWKAIRLTAGSFPPVFTWK